jgi:hypothetical protein
VSTLRSWIRKVLAVLEVMAPIKARTPDAWQVIFGSWRRPAGTRPQIMQRGIERC